MMIKLWRLPYGVSQPALLLRVRGGGQPHVLFCSLLLLLLKFGWKSVVCQLKILLHPAPHQVEDEVLVDQKQAEKMILQGHGDNTNSITAEDSEEHRD